MWQTATKLKFSNGYYSVIFKVKIYDKISRHWELPREFKNAKKNPKKFWEDFLKNLWKSAIFKNWKNIFLKIDDFQRIFKKSSQIFFGNIFELARQFWMCTDFIINFHFNWVIAIWKIQLWISLPHICWKLIQSRSFQTAITQSFLKSKFMRNSVDIENCLASSKMQKYFKKKFGKIF